MGKKGEEGIKVKVNEKEKKRKEKGKRSMCRSDRNPK